VALGGTPEFALALLNEASAYPHGSRKPEAVREGSVILMDCGCTVHGYQSDISRTWVHGAASARQRKVWNTVKRGQEIALETAKPGIAAGTIDDAVRSYYEGEGWGPGYKLPGLSHRTGHGIGLDGHESPYLVHGDATPLQAGMCFSDEPGIYIPGEFGIRLEDCWHMTPTGDLHAARQIAGRSDLNPSVRPQACVARVAAFRRGQAASAASGASGSYPRFGASQRSASARSMPLRWA
jgi:Xaa-Pro dipeptidase